MDDERLRAAMSEYVKDLRIDPPARVAGVQRRARYHRRVFILTVAIGLGALGVAVPASLVSLASWFDRSGQVPTGANPSATPSAPAEDPPHRDCGSRLVGEGGVDGQRGIPPDWRDHSIMAGPVGFYRPEVLANVPRERFAPDSSGRLQGTAFYVILEKGAVANLKVKEEDRESLALIALPTAEGSPWHSFSEGSEMVRLSACTDTDTEFLLSIMLYEPRCAAIEVQAGDLQRTVRLPIGKTC